MSPLAFHYARITHHTRYPRLRALHYLPPTPLVRCLHGFSTLVGLMFGAQCGRGSHYAVHWPPGESHQMCRNCTFAQRDMGRTCLPINNISRSLSNGCGFGRCLGLTAGWGHGLAVPAGAHYVGWVRYVSWSQVQPTQSLIRRGVIWFVSLPSVPGALGAVPGMCVYCWVPVCVCVAGGGGGD